MDKQYADVFEKFKANNAAWAHLGRTLDGEASPSDEELRAKIKRLVDEKGDPTAGMYVDLTAQTVGKTDEEIEAISIAHHARRNPGWTPAPVPQEDSFP
jgi:hypothetical protein